MKWFANILIEVIAISIAAQAGFCVGLVTYAFARQDAKQS